MSHWRSMAHRLLTAVKVAMVNAWRRIRKDPRLADSAFLVLQIHDEVLLEVKVPFALLAPCPTRLPLSPLLRRLERLGELQHRALGPGQAACEDTMRSRHPWEPKSPRRRKNSWRRWRSLCARS